MERVITFHPAAAVNKTLNGAISEKVDNGVTTTFSFWQQRFAVGSDLKSYFQAVTILSDLDTTQNVLFRLVFRKLTADVGTNVRLLLRGRFFDPASGANDRETAILADVVKSSTIPVPAGGSDSEFVVTFTEAGATFIGQLGKEFLFEVSRNGTDILDDYPGDIALVRIDVVQQQTVSSFWQSGTPANNIYYGLGNVGIGISTPTESLHTTGAILLGTTPNTIPGTIRWTGVDFEGRTGGGWVSLTTGVGNNLDQAYDAGGPAAGRTINIIKNVIDYPVLLQRDASAPDYGLHLVDDLRIALGTTPRGFLGFTTTLTSALRVQTVGDFDIEIQSGDVGGSTTGNVAIATGVGTASGSIGIFTGASPTRGDLLCSANNIFIEADTSITLLSGPSTARTAIQVGILADGTLGTGSNTPNSIEIFNGRTDLVPDNGAAELILYNKNGVPYRVWIDAAGVLRVGNHTTDVDGVVVGTQT